MGVLQLIVYALQFLPAILQAVKGVEQAFPNAAGPVKKEAIMETVDTAAMAGEGPLSPAQRSIISTTIDKAVARYNAQGEFQKKQ
jgi:hypothetical protein